MGLGGDLFWTVVAKELYKKHQKKIIFFRNHEHLKSKMWINNPYIEIDDIETKICNKDLLKIDLMPLKKNLKNEVKLNYHAIIYRCELLGLKPESLRPVINYTEVEESKIKEVLKILPSKFICIEPNAKTTWTPNKKFPFNKWQNIVNELNKYNLTIVQIGIPGLKSLDGVIDIRDKVHGIRETGCLIKYCDLYLSTEGCLSVVSAANGNRSLTIYSPMFNPSISNYNLEHYHYLWIYDEKHKNCYKLEKCKECQKLMKNFNESILIKKILKILDI